MTSIQRIAVELPANEVTNEDLAREHPAWAMDLVGRRLGIRTRRVVADGETAYDLSVRACETLFEQDGIAPGDVDAILYCTQDPDHLMPGNAHLLHRHLELGDAVLAFDYRLACSGFVYGLAFADAFARAGMASGLLLVTAETPSRRINRADRSARVLFGDGAAVTYVSSREETATGGEVVACELCSHGAGFEHGYVPAGGARLPLGEETRRETTDVSGNVRTAEELQMKGPRLWGFVCSAVPRHIEAFLERQSLTLDDIDVCVFHQASTVILDSIAKALSIPPEKMFVHMGEVGNLSSASIPVALRAALDEEAIKPGDRVLLSGFGTGISYGSAIVQY